MHLLWAPEGDVPQNARKTAKPFGLLAWLLRSVPFLSRGGSATAKTQWPGMIGDLNRRLDELRFLPGIEKVEHVPYGTGDEFWVRFDGKLDVAKLSGMAKARGYEMVRFANLPSKLPRSLSEVLWDGVAYVVAKKLTGWQRFTAGFGFEPDGIAKVAVDLHSGHQIFIATDETGIKLLYEYLGAKYVAPAPPPPKPAAVPVKPAATPVKPVTPTPAGAPKPVAPVPTVSSTPKQAATSSPPSLAGAKPSAPQLPIPQPPAKQTEAQPSGSTSVQAEPASSKPEEATQPKKKAEPEQTSTTRA